MTSSTGPRDETQTKARTVVVTFDVLETLLYRGAAQIDPVDFHETTGIELHRATGAEIRSYAIDANIPHEENDEEVQGQEWSNPTVHGLPDERIAFEVDGMRGAQMVEDVRVLVDPARYEEATSAALETAHAAEVLAYITERADECDFDGEEFVPVRICRAR